MGAARETGFKTQFPAVSTSNLVQMVNVWIIDDEIDWVKDMVKFWKLKAPDAPFRYKVFETAQEALSALESLPVSSVTRPDVVIVDGHLRSDSGALSHGNNVVERIREFAPVAEPHIIAWSADPFAAADMMAARADAEFSKTGPRQVLDYMLRECGEL